jgi:hypothetical protein
LAGLVDVFDGCDDHHDVLAWMDNVAILFATEPLPVEQSSPVGGPAPVEESSHVEELAHVEERSPEVVHDSSSAAFPDSENIAPEQIEQQLAGLMQQHANPTFNDGDLDKALEDRHDFNYNFAIYDDSGFEDDGEHATMPGRCAFPDAADMTYIFQKLRDRLPLAVLDHLSRHDEEYWYKYRRFNSGSNVCLDALVLRWHELNSPPGAIKALQDILDIEIARVKRFTPACQKEERHQGLTAWSRPYLTDEEEEAINHGICEYNMYSTQYPVLSKVQKQLQVNPENAKLPGYNPVPNWLDSINEEELLNPNDFEPCCCGDQASEFVTAYRNEVELNYDPARSFLSEFPLLFLDHKVIWPRWCRKAAGAEGKHDGLIPRCKKIQQVCDLHEMISNNIFVLVDTSVDNINDRIVDLHGPLPVPGSPSRMEYPEGFQTKPRFIQIPYEELAPRCTHGLLHPPWRGSCNTCFLPSNHVNCAECAKYNAIQKKKAAEDGPLRRPKDVLRGVATPHRARDSYKPVPSMHPQTPPLPRGRKLWFEK